MRRVWIGSVAVVLVGCFSEPASASCTTLPEASTAPIVNSFLIRPQSAMEPYPRGSDTFIATIRNVVTANPDATIAPILDLLKTANRYQKKDIGTALGGAARQCDRVAQTWQSRRFLEAIRVKQDPDLSAAFMNAYRTQVPLAPLPATIDKPTHPLGTVFNSSPDVNAFSRPKLSNPFAPIK